MRKVFDIGMYDGADTAYYLELGCQVVAVEANPELVTHARKRFADPIASGQLTVVNAAISPDGKPARLRLCAADLGSSSLLDEDDAASAAIEVPGVTIDALFADHGVPDYLKIDIETADRLCVLALVAGSAPRYLSFEMGDDAEELVQHAASVGYTGFKAISQISFRELANERCLTDRLAHRAMRWLGYREPRLVRRGGRFFVTEHSSGPVPWLSDGRWHPAEAIVDRLQQAREAGALRGWYDIHATQG